MFDIICQLKWINHLWILAFEWLVAMFNQYQLVADAFGVSCLVVVIFWLTNAIWSDSLKVIALTAYCNWRYWSVSVMKELHCTFILKWEICREKAICCGCHYISIVLSRIIKLRKWVWRIRHNAAVGFSSRLMTKLGLLNNLISISFKPLYMVKDWIWGCRFLYDKICISRVNHISQIEWD